MKKKVNKPLAKKQPKAQKRPVTERELLAWYLWSEIDRKDLGYAGWNSIINTLNVYDQTAKRGIYDDLRDRYGVFAEQFYPPANLGFDRSNEGDEEEKQDDEEIAEYDTTPTAADIARACKNAVDALARKYQYHDGIETLTELRKRLLRLN